MSNASVGHRVDRAVAQPVTSLMHEFVERSGADKLTITSHIFDRRPPAFVRRRAQRRRGTHGPTSYFAAGAPPSTSFSQAVTSARIAFTRAGSRPARSARSPGSIRTLNRNRRPASSTYL
jgi:hypothetical protein